jgi:hypothetical protein
MVAQTEKAIRECPASREAAEFQPAARGRSCSFNRHHDALFTSIKPALRGYRDYPET